MIGPSPEWTNWEIFQQFLAHNPNYQGVHFKKKIDNSFKGGPFLTPHNTSGEKMQSMRAVPYGEV